MVLSGQKGDSIMEKIRLKNGKEINVEGGMTSKYFESVVENYDKMKEVYFELTEENMQYIEVINDSGLVCAVLKNKRLDSERRFEEVADTGNIKLKISMEDIDARELQLNQVAANTDYLVMMQGM